MTDNNPYKRMDTGGWSLDAELRSADWTKGRHWDLPLDVYGFLEVLGISNAPLTEQQRALNLFCHLPAAQSMPVELSDELRRKGLFLL